jgi:hypothetical protein
MNYGWDLTTEWGRATALHEIGHAIGMPHEHQNPLSGIVWNEPAVYANFAKPPNKWDQQKTFNNILRKIPVAEVEGSTWDPASIMHYPFGPGLIAAPTPYNVQGIGRNVALSAKDSEWALRFYPPLDAPSAIGVMQLEPLPHETGGQRDFIFEPDATREYTIQTLGASDCKIVVFEERDAEPRHLVAEDDSGEAANTQIKVKLVSGRTYFIRVRVHYVSGPSGARLIVL